MCQMVKSLKKIWDGINIIFIEENKSRLVHWAIDISHIDIEYEWFKMGTIEKSQLKVNILMKLLG